MLGSAEDLAQLRNSYSILPSIFAYHAHWNAFRLEVSSSTSASLYTQHRKIKGVKATIFIKYHWLHNMETQRKTNNRAGADRKFFPRFRAGKSLSR
jgi:hypothetical protein